MLGGRVVREPGSLATFQLFQRERFAQHVHGVEFLRSIALAYSLNVIAGGISLEDRARRLRHQMRLLGRRRPWVLSSQIAP